MSAAIWSFIFSACMRGNAKNGVRRGDWSVATCHTGIMLN